MKGWTNKYIPSPLHPSICLLSGSVAPMDLGATHASPGRMARPPLSRIWSLGQIHKPLDFLTAMLPLNLLFIPTLRVSTQGWPCLLTEVEKETISRSSYIWKSFSALISLPRREQHIPQWCMRFTESSFVEY